MSVFLSESIAAGGSSKQWLIGKLGLIELNNIRLNNDHPLFTCCFQPEIEKYMKVLGFAWILHFLFFLHCVTIVLTFITDGASDTQLAFSVTVWLSVKFSVTLTVRTDPQWWGLCLHLMGLTNLYLAYLLRGIGKTGGVCQTEQLLLCNNPSVTGLWPLFCGTRETYDIIFPAVQHSSLTHLLNFSIKGTLSIEHQCVFWGSSYLIRYTSYIK